MKKEDISASRGQKRAVFEYEKEVEISVHKLCKATGSSRNHKHDEFKPSDCTAESPKLFGCEIFVRGETINIVELL